MLRLTVILKGDSRIDLAAALHTVAEQVRYGETPPRLKGTYWTVEGEQIPATD